VLLGVKGPKALRLAGESADGVHCAVLASPEHVARVRQTAGAGRPRFTVIAYVLTAISRDGRHAREAVRPLIAHYLGVLHGQSILLDAGLGPDRTRPFREALDRGAAAAHLVDDALIDAVAVAGTPEHCRRQLARWAEAGLDAPIAVLPRDAERAGADRALRGDPGAGVAGGAVDHAIRRAHPDLYRGHDVPGAVREALRHPADRAPVRAARVRLGVGATTT